VKVLLIKPFNRSDHIQPVLGLGYLATAVRNSGHQVHILDCIKDNIYGDSLLESIKKVSPDLIGFQIYTYDLARVRKDLELIKNNFPDIITIAGGPHPSALSKETFEHMNGNLDFIFKGESEISLPKFLDFLEKVGVKNCLNLEASQVSDIGGLCFMRSGKLFSNPVVLIDDLDSLGFPAWDIIKPNLYPEAQHGAFFKRFPIAPIMTGRGCPFNCTFCAGCIITGKKVRKRSVANVIEEIKILTKDYGIKEIHIVDDNFSMYKNYVIDFCNKLKSENINISWATPNGVRLDTLDKEMLQLMKETGYYLASVGIEFGSDRMLTITKKHLNKAKIEKGVKLIRDVGLDVAGFFMMGYPGETEQEINQTIDFALKLPLIRANFFIFLPLPGTEVYGELEKRYELGRVDWEHFYFSHPAYAYGGFSPRELKNLQRKAFLRFYLRPHIFFKNIFQIKSFRQFKFLLKRAYRWILAF